MSNLSQYGRALNTHDLVKILAVILMIIDHMGEFVFPSNPWLRVIGRASAPLFFFLVGYVNHLHMRPTLFIYGFILSITGFFQTGHMFINILFNFVMIQLILWIFPPESLRLSQRIFGFTVAVALNIILSRYLEYGLLGLLLAYCARLLAQEDKQAPYWLSASLLTYLIWEAIIFKFISNTEIIITLFAMMVGLFIIFTQYRFKTFTLHQIQFPAMILARYSLDIYFLHFFALQIWYFHRVLS